MKFLTLFALIALLPTTASAQSLQTLIPGIIGFIDTVLIPFLLGLTFLIFVYSAVKYFVIEGDNEKGQEKAKSLALYGVLAFVFVIIFFGLVKIVTLTTGLESTKPVCPDYLKEKGECKSPPPIPGKKPPVPDGFVN
ncbi:MAG: hypothetical protein UZ19_OD1000308 [Parcubacteria bacterium OLB19]|nr:MAG: hypothetical protein UZ19_OD1000308 [Parcubacteria bacterium OLB19]